MIDGGQLLLTEYEHIKQEQRARIGFRDNLLYATLGTMAAVVASTLTGQGRIQLLLLMPPLSVILGWTYLVNDEKISAIGRYVRQELAPRLKELAPGEPEVFAWEKAHRTDERRRSRKAIQLAVDLLAFCAAPLAALVVYWMVGPPHWQLLLVSGLEALAIGGLAHQITRYADLDR
ncbi:hypothetical protein FH609_024455 [Streptomyces sp. 3MP-14]|uniref:Integral membrane protein n=1 Tax=Streptomyces mimosae TaxID=2586635 RepID=A0A5N6A3D9_9ACTN|nr:MULTISPECIES: hypothetical protein [Streptomyces]KAB8162220.1 hypothetical protein FH607_022280 [Streptomyces mimosae]KAB8173881.1 hypothetical protein FH609_024455 [Streptomyces sp. 3MP-14]